jgi:hypothetical protein
MTVRSVIRLSVETIEQGPVLGGDGVDVDPHGLVHPFIIIARARCRVRAYGLVVRRWGQPPSRPWRWRRGAGRGGSCPAMRSQLIDTGREVRSMLF